MENYNYPGNIFNEAWQITLPDQFHDVLPGSAIPETYNDVWDLWGWQLEQYQQLKKRGVWTIDR